MKKLLLIIAFVPVTGISAETADYYYRLGREAMQQNNTLEAVKNYRKSLRVNNAFTPTLIAMGTLMRETGAYGESIDYLKKALKLKPKSTETLIELAETYLEVNNTVAARDTVSKGLSIAPYQPDFNYLMAEIYQREGRTYLAQKKLEQILRSSPNHFKSRLALGRIYLSQRRYNRAEKEFEKARLIRPQEPDVFIRMAEIRLRQITDRKDDLLFDNKPAADTFAPAIELLMNAKGYDNFYVPANMQLARIYALTGQCGESENYLKTVLHINPEHYEANYYLGYCKPGRIREIYRKLLRRYSNDEITRFSYEWNLINTIERREHPSVMKTVRSHYSRGRSLIRANRLFQGLFEIRWSKFLFPGYLDAHEHLFRHYRSSGDFLRMKDELKFLRTRTDKIIYRDMYEQLVVSRRDKLHYRYNISEPRQYGSETPFFVFYFRPENPFTPYPDAGRAITEKIVFALNDIGRIDVFDHSLRQKIYRDLESLNTFGFGRYYNSSSVKKVREHIDGRSFSYSELPFDRPALRYVMRGSYSLIADGVNVSIEIIDIDKTTVLGRKEFSASGRGFLRALALQVAGYVYKTVPYHGHVLKISGNSVIINMGTREGLKNGQRLNLLRGGRPLGTAVVKEIDTDLLRAVPQGAANLIYRLQPGDRVIP